MVGDGILDGDYLVVDTSLEATPGTLILGWFATEFVVGYFRKTPKATLVEFSNPAFKPVQITQSSDFWVWGVITGVCRKLA